MPRVLVIDDNLQLREVLDEYLQAKGYEVIPAATGGEGLRRLQETRPHLLVLDFRLPDMSGLEVLRQAKALDPAVGVIMVTGLAEDEVGRQALQAGASECLTKPLDLRHLEQRLADRFTSRTP